MELKKKKLKKIAELYATYETLARKICTYTGTG